MNDDVKKFLVDILESINSIEDYIGPNKNLLIIQKIKC
jgi:uncharacterized protein with HEPN domain